MSTITPFCNANGSSSSIVGATGATGPQGLAGPTGASGIAAANGMQGQQGATGPTGFSGGTVGATGVAGVAGGAGATGATGPAGPVGVSGSVGITGVSGLNTLISASDFATPGTYTVTVPAGANFAAVTLIGGGGSGGSGQFSQEIDSIAGGGGGGGVFFRYPIAVVPGVVLSVTVGAGGAAPTTNLTPGNAGGTTSLYLDANGLGTINMNAIGGAGGYGGLSSTAGTATGGNGGNTTITPNATGAPPNIVVPANTSVGLGGVYNSSNPLGISTFNGTYPATYGFNQYSGGGGGMVSTNVPQGYGLYGNGGGSFASWKSAGGLIDAGGFNGKTFYAGGGGTALNAGASAFDPSAVLGAGSGGIGIIPINTTMGDTYYYLMPGHDGYASIEFLTNL